MLCRCNTKKKSARITPPPRCRARVENGVEPRCDLVVPSISFGRVWSITNYYEWGAWWEEKRPLSIKGTASAILVVPKGGAFKRNSHDRVTVQTTTIEPCGHVATTYIHTCVVCVIGQLNLSTNEKDEKYRQTKLKGEAESQRESPEVDARCINVAKKRIDFILGESQGSLVFPSVYCTLYCTSFFDRKSKKCTCFWQFCFW